MLPLGISKINRKLGNELIFLHAYPNSVQKAFLIIHTMCSAANSGQVNQSNDGLNIKKSKLKMNNEKNRSLKRMKKRGVMQQVMEKFPQKSSKNAEMPVETEPERPFSRDINAVNQKPETEAEPIYESRKLLIRQMQGMIAKEVLKDRKGTDGVGSEYDSWSDLEENFARAYEPIPLNIRMETWRKMSKKEILKTVNSKQMKKDFEYMSHSEIILSIEKMHTSAKYLSNKFGVDHLLQHNHPPLTKRQLERANKKGRPVDIESIVDSDFPTNQALNKAGPVPGISRSQVVKQAQLSSQGVEPNYDNMKKFVNSKHGIPAKIHDSWSSRASSILKDPQVPFIYYVSTCKGEGG